MRGSCYENVQKLPDNSKISASSDSSSSKSTPAALISLSEPGLLIRSLKMRRFLLQTPKLLQPLQTRLLQASQAYSSASSTAPTRQNSLRPQTNPRELGGALERTTPARAYLSALIASFTSTPALLQSHSWPSTLAHCKSIDFSITDANFGGLVLQACIRNECVPAAASFVASSQNPNQAVLSSYLFLLSRSSSHSSDPPDVDLILRLYDSILAKNRGVWDLVTAERVIPALCRTPKWRDSLKILESVRIGGTLAGIPTYDAVIVASFENSDPTLGWSLMEEQGAKKPGDASLSAALRAGTEAKASLERIFDFMDFYEIYPTRALINAVAEHLKPSGLQGVETRIVNGACARCSTRLAPNHLTGTEFAQLSSAFLGRVLEAGDVFINTNPAELRKFKTFVEAQLQAPGSRPFDVVIDGLNVAYMGHKGKPSIPILQQVVRDFLGRGGQRVLVVGRKHMLRWPGFHQAFPTRGKGGGSGAGVEVYLIEDASEDDPFLIYAALRSGPSTRLVSNDQLRNHTFRLQDRELARLFKRWRLSRQLYHDDRRRMVPVTGWLPVPQKTETTEGGRAQLWHVPFSEEKLKSCYEFPDKWICFK